MDFLQSAINDEISKKRKTIETVARNGDGSKKKKYVSRAELERLREEEYRREEAEREAKEREVQSQKTEMRQPIHKAVISPCCSISVKRDKDWKL